MARSKGLLVLSGNWEPQVAAPFDARNVVGNKSDLTLNATWLAKDGGNYAYAGMMVVVASDATLSNRGLYILVDPDYTNINNWQKTLSSTGSSGLTGVRLEGITTGSTMTLPASAKLDSIYIITDTAVNIDVNITTNSVTTDLLSANFEIGESVVNINILPSIIHDSTLAFTGTFGVADIDVVLIYNLISIA